MAIGSSTFSAAGGATSDLFAGVGALFQGDLKAKGLQLNAEGLRLKATGDLAEASEYDLAGNLAGQNEKFAETSSAIQQMQADRELTMALGQTKADVAGAGFAESGSALDILASSASQGALTKAVLGQQGLINEAGYEEQQQSYQLMASTARTTAAGEQDIANQTDQLANETRTASFVQGAGDFIGSALKGAAAIASL